MEGIPTVLACVNLLSETVSSLPLKVYRSAGDGSRDEAGDHPLARVLRSPNERMNGVELREWLMRSLLLTGNGYCRAVWDSRGALQALIPIMPGSVSPHSLPNGRLAYDVASDAGGRQRLLQDEVLHIRYLSSDGVTGRSPIAVAAETMGVALAEQRHAAAFYNNRARPDLVLASKVPITAEQASDAREAWQKLYGGPHHAYRPAVIPFDLDVKTISMSHSDAEFIAGRRLTSEQICAIFNVPPPLVANLERATFANVSELMKGFVRLSVRPWLVRLEQAIMDQLVSDAARSSLTVEHVVEGLLRADTEQRYRSYALGRQWGWLSINDIRRLENMPPVAGGETYLQPLNMADAAGEGEVDDLQPSG